MTRDEWDEKIRSSSISTIIQLNNFCINEAGRQEDYQALTYFYRVVDFDKNFASYPPSYIANMVKEGHYNPEDTYYYFDKTNRFVTFDPKSIGELCLNFNALYNILSNPQIEVRALQEVYGEKWGL